MKRVDEKQNGLQSWGDHSICPSTLSHFHASTLLHFDTSLSLIHFPSPSWFVRIGDVNFRLSPILDGWAVSFLMDWWESWQERGGDVIEMAMIGYYGGGRGGFC